MRSDCDNSGQALVQWLIPWSGRGSGVCQVHTSVCLMWSWLCIALMWSETGPQICLELLGRASGASQSQPAFVPGLRPPGKSYKVICSWSLLELGLGDLGRSYAVN